MIHLNLLPDVKKQYIKAKRTKRLIMTLSIVSSAVSIAVVVLVFSIVRIGQQRHLDNLTKDIAAQASSIRNINDINGLLTAQNQLSQLPQLHEAKPEVSRMFAYLSALIPETSEVDSLSLDNDTEILTISGQSESIAEINKLVDIIKFATVKEVQTDEDEPVSDEEVLAFVVERTQLSGNEQSASFDISFTFDPVLFDNTREVQLILNDPRNTPGSSEIEGGQDAN